MIYRYAVVFDFSGDDLNSYAIAFGRVLLSKWEHMGSKCNGGLLVLVSVKDSLVKFQRLFSFLATS
jgi:hypothetical protein